MTGYDNFEIEYMTLDKCKRHNRYQREEFWRSKAINKLLDAIQKGYVPVGGDVRRLEQKKRK